MCNNCDRATTAVLANLVFVVIFSFTLHRELCSGLIQKDLLLKEGEVWLKFFFKHNIIVKLVTQTCCLLSSAVISGKFC